MMGSADPRIVYGAILAGAFLLLVLSALLGPRIDQLWERLTRYDRKVQRRGRRYR